MVAHGRRSLALFVLIIISAPLGLCGCSRAANPVSPSSQTALTSQSAGAQPIGLSGVVSTLNLDSRTFVVAWRGGSRLVLADAETVVWSQASNSQVRLSALKNGQSVAVRGTDQARYVLARSIVIGR